MARMLLSRSPSSPEALTDLKASALDRIDTIAALGTRHGVAVAPQRGYHAQPGRNQPAVQAGLRVGATLH